MKYPFSFQKQLIKVDYDDENTADEKKHTDEQNEKADESDAGNVKVLTLTPLMQTYETQFHNKISSSPL